MNSENVRKLQKEIINVGYFLKEKLPNQSNHSKVRNSYAHVALEIKNKFKTSYKNIPDEKYSLVLEFINFLKKNPS